jgi:hypothetical protein
MTGFEQQLTRLFLAVQPSHALDHVRITTIYTDGLKSFEGLTEAGFNTSPVPNP